MPRVASLAGDMRKSIRRGGDAWRDDGEALEARSSLMPRALASAGSLNKRLRCWQGVVGGTGRVLRKQWPVRVSVS